MKHLKNDVERGPGSKVQDPSWHALLVTFILVGGGMGLIVCSNKARIRRYRIPKEHESESAEHAPSLHDAIQEPPPHEDPDHKPGDLHWEIPANWQELTSTGMRRAHFRIPGEAGKSAEFSIVVLQGDGGGVVANINRWRAQIQLPAITEKELSEHSHSVSSLAGEALVVDLLPEPGDASPGLRTLGAILPLGEQTWFLKMTGDDSVRGSAKPDFEEFVKQLTVYGK